MDTSDEFLLALKQIKRRSPIRRNENVDEISTEASETTLTEDDSTDDDSIEDALLEEESVTLESMEGISSKSRFQTTRNIKPTSENSEHLKPPSETTGTLAFLLSSVWFWSLCLCAVAAYWYISSTNEMNVHGSHNPKTVETEETRCDGLNATKNLLSEEDYLALRVGIQQTLFGKPTMPSVFTFLQNDSPDAGSSMETIGQRTHDCFGLNSKILYLDTEFFLSEDITRNHGMVIDLIKSKLAHGGILVVPNLQEVPAHVARAFHVICDIHTPLVNKLIVYFTLTPRSLNDSSDTSHSQQDIPTHVAESTLRYLWSELRDYELQPLVTRITDQVLWLRQNS